MNDERRLLASAALDGAATADELARLAADPELAAEVARLRAVRQALRVDEAPDPARRERTLTAALTELDAGVPAVAPPQPSRPRRHRRRWAPLAAAAALVVVVAGGIVAVTTRDGGGDDDSAATAELSELDAVAATSGSDVGAGEEAERPAATSAAAGAAAAATLPAAESAAPAAPPDADRLLDATDAPTIDGPAALTAFAAGGGDELVAADGAGPPACGIGTLIGPARYLVDGTPVPVEVVETASPAEVLAVALDDCAIVGRAPAP